MPQLEIRILLDDAGRLGVGGNIENKLIALGMLAEAVNSIHEYHKEKQNRLVQPATMLPPVNPFVKD